MKKPAVFYFCLLLFSELQAQLPYHPMLEKGRTWEVFTQPAELAICPFIYGRHYFLKDDTLVGGNIYKKLYYNGIQSNPPAPYCEGFYIDTAYTLLYPAFFREDTTARKVYIREPGQAEFVLYDFSLQVGDTLFYPDYSYPITGIEDWVLPSGEHRKAYRINNWQNNLYVEGLGYLLGAINRVNYPFEGGDLTTCIRDSSETLYELGYPGCISAISPTRTPETSAWKVSPSLFTRYLSLERPENGSDEAILFELYNLGGQLVFRETLNPGLLRYSLALPELSAGGYLWTIGGRAGGKLVRI